MLKKYLVIAITAFSMSAFADKIVVSENYGDSGKKFYEDKNRGWHSYEDLPEEVIKKLEELERKVAKLTKEAEAKKTKPMSSKWFRENLQFYRDKAIDKPTEENVLTLNLLEKVMREKASNFALRSAKVSIKYPVFNATSPAGNITALKDEYLKSKAKKELFVDLGKDKALWFFYEDHCQQCEVQGGILRGVADDLGWQVLPISIDGNPLANGAFPKFVKDQGQAKQLGLIATPAIYVMDPKTLDISNISQNVVLRDGLIHRVIEMSHDMGWISDEDYNLTNKRNTKLQMTSKDLDEIDLNDSEKLNGALIDMLTKKGGF
jgi:conjugal transfer pilus assembly protein TraF